MRLDSCFRRNDIQKGDPSGRPYALLTPKRRQGKMKTAFVNREVFYKMARERKEIPKSYDPKQIEGKWYQFWMERGYFTPKIDHTKKPFVIIMPPPNVTGELHLGTALAAIVEDTMTRWHRMKGDPTLWLPGSDHAGIAGQNVVEQLLAKEGLTRHDIGREKFLERMWQSM